MDIIANNVYTIGGDVKTGIGFVHYLDTSYPNPTTMEGTIAFNTGETTDNCPETAYCSWRKDFNRTDDPLGKDAEKLTKASNGSDSSVCYKLVASGDYKKEYYVGDALDLSGIQLAAYWTSGKTTDVALKDVTISGYNKDEAGTQYVRLTYKEVNCLITVTVIPRSSKSRIATLLIFLLVIPVTLYFGLRLTGRAYYLTSTLVIIEIIIPFLLAFESRRPQARELVVIAVLSALAVAARVAIPIPNFKAIFAIIMLSGIAFGPEAGFLVGAVSAFASNFFYGQGAYTPWQMFAYGAGGMLAGFLFAKGRLPQKRWVMAVFGFLACVLFVGPLLDTCTVFLTLPVINAQTAWPLYISGFPVNISQGVCTALTMVLFGPALLEKLDRVKLQYGMTEDGNGV